MKLGSRTLVVSIFAIACGTLVAETGVILKSELGALAALVGSLLGTGLGAYAAQSGMEWNARSKDQSSIAMQESGRPVVTDATAK